MFSRVILLILPLLVLACGEVAEDTTPLSPPVLETALDGHIPARASINQDLAAVRRLTAPFHNIDKAAAAGWGVPVTPCLELPPEGAQGVHYANVGLIDGSVSLLEPEILVYEPQSNGRMRLVGVEYIVPLNFDEPPPLLGQHFHANEEAGIWALHVWAWRHNPSGMFADWNPKVSCEHAN